MPEDSHPTPSRLKTPRNQFNVRPYQPYDTPSSRTSQQCSTNLPPPAFPPPSLSYSTPNRSNQMSTYTPSRPSSQVGNTKASRVAQIATPPSTATKHSVASSEPSSSSSDSSSSSTTYAFISHSPASYRISKPEIDNAQLARRKRRRTSPTELSVLEREYSIADKPDKKTRELIAHTVGMSEKAVQIWFQNRRAHERNKRRARDIAVDSSTNDRPQPSYSSGITTSMLMTPTTPVAPQVHTPSSHTQVYTNMQQPSTTPTKPERRRLPLSAIPSQPNINSVRRPQQHPPHPSSLRSLSSAEPSPHVTSASDEVLLPTSSPSRIPSISTILAHTARDTTDKLELAPVRNNNAL